MTTNTFNHPFQPYDIQVEFMTELYNCVEEGKVGIFESPTGELNGGSYGTYQTNES
jgi:chromosome transmission fidelity protein 1